MKTAEYSPQLRVSCTDCHYSEVVDRAGGKAADLIVEHGRETGHKLTTEGVEPASTQVP